MSKKSSMLLGILLILLFGIKYAEGQSQEIKPNETIRVQHNEVQQTRYFEFKVGQKIDQEDVIIITKPLNPRSDPDIYVSTVEKQPNVEKVENESILKCNSLGYDICLYPGNLIRTNDTVYIGVYCIFQCEYELHVHYSSNIKVNVKTNTITSFSNSQPKKFIFTVPQDIIEDHIIINAYPLNPYVMKESFYMKVEKEGEGLKPSLNIPVRDSWYSSKLAIVSEADHSFERGATYRVIIQCEDSLILKLIIEPESKIKELFINVKDYNAFNTGNRIYKLSLKGINSDILTKENLNIEVQSYAGSLSIGVNPDTMPTAYEKYQWKVSDLDKLQLQLSPEDRKKARARDEEYYIIVDSVYACSFSILGYLATKNNTNLEFGIAEIGTINNNDLVYYNLKMWGQVKQQFTITLLSTVGNADLFVKRCVDTNNMNCKLNISEVRDISEGNYDKVDQKNIFYSIRPDSADVIQLEYVPGECNKKLFGVGKSCNYIIGIYSNSVSTNYSSYVLRANLEKVHVVLSEGKLERYYLDKGDKQYFMFSIPEAKQEEIDSVTIQFQSISGISYFTVTRQTKYPLAKDQEDAALVLEERVMYNRSDIKNKNGVQLTLNGPYYIQVECILSSCYYTLNVQVVREERKLEDPKKVSSLTLVQLLFDIQNQFSLNNNQRTALFYFDLDLTQQFQGDIELIGYGDHQTNYQIQLTNNGEIPTEQNSLWKSLTKGRIFLKFNSSDINFKKQARYVGKITLQHNHTESDHINNFKIGLYISGRYKLLFDNTPYKNILGPSGFEYFRIYLSANDQKITISKHTTSDDVDMYVSLSTKISFPDKASHDFASEKDKFGNIVLKQENIQKVCPDLYSNKSKIIGGCGIFLGVFNPTKNNVTYSVLVRKYQAVVYLFSENTVELDYPTDEDYLHFVVYCGQTCMISATSAQGGLQLYAKVYNESEYRNVLQSNFKFPDSPEKAHIISNDTSYSFYQSIYINQSNYQNICKGYQCRVALTIQVKSEKKLRINDSPKILINVASRIVPLQEGKTIKGTVQKAGIRYYSFEVNREKCNILISLTPLSGGDPDLVVGFGLDKLPTKVEYDWASQTFQSEQLEITPEKVKGKSMQGTYVIGVISEEYCTFQLTVVYEETQVIDIYAGNPQELSLKEDASIYLKYFHFFDNKISILANIDVGSIEFSINKYNKSQEYLDHLPNFLNSTWNFFNIETKDSMLTIDKNDKQYCYNCFYIIQAKSLFKPSKFSIIVKSTESPIYLTKGKAIIDQNYPNEQTKYLFSVEEPTNLLFQFSISYGNPKFYISNEFYQNDQPPQYEYEVDPNNNTVYQFSIPQEKIIKDLECKKPKYKVLEETDQQNEPCFKYDLYIIVSQCQQICKYQLNVLAEKSKLILQEGKKFYSKISANSSQTLYFFSIYALEYNQKLQVSLEGNLFQKVPLILNITLEKKKAGGSPFERGVIRDPIISSQIYRSIDNKVDIQIDAEEGIYIFNVTNNQGFDQDYSIIASVENLRQIHSNSSNTVYVTKNQPYIYEIQAEKTGTLVLKVQECIGSVLIKAASTYKGIISKEYDLGRFRQSTGDDSNLVLQVRALDKVFIQFEFLEGMIFTSGFSKEKQALVHFSPIILSGDQRIPKFSAGNQGRIEWQLDQEMQLQVKFKPLVMIEEGDNKRNLTSLYYYVIIAKNQFYLDTITRCGNVGLDSSDIKSEFTNVDQFSIWHFSVCEDYDTIGNNELCNTTLQLKNQLGDNVDPKQNYLVNVVGYIYQRETQETSRVVYSQVQFNTGYTITSKYSFWVWLSPLIVLILIVLLFVIYKKYKYVEAKLNYELQDVRNVASVRQEGKFPNLVV